MLVPMVSQRHRLRLLNFMRRFLFVALAAGLLSPTAANAESIWLIYRAAIPGQGVATNKVEMQSLKQCYAQAKKLLESKTFMLTTNQFRRKEKFSYESIEGK